MTQRSIPELVAGRVLPVVAPDITVREACRVLDRCDIGAVLVMRDERLIGILSERDVIGKCICQGRLTAETPVRAIMTPDPTTVSVGAPVDEALRMMLDGGFRHLPVLNGARVVGLLSLRDIPAEIRARWERQGDDTDPRAAA